MNKNEQKHWSGYLRSDGRKGIRNKILVMYTVECSQFVAEKITQLAHHSDVECIGFSGCTDNAYAIRLLLSCIRHPNVGALLVVGLGCEYTQAETLAAKAREENKLSDWLLIQKEGGTKATIEKGLQIVEFMITALKATPRVPMYFSDLVIGAECGGSDYTSGLAGNVVVGNFFDRLVDEGGTAVFEELVEAIGLKTFLLDRARDARVKEQLSCTYQKVLAYCQSVKQYSISPGNFVGGLTTIEEKSMGALVKSGTKPLEGVLKVSGKIPHPGLWVLDSTPDPYWMQFGITNPNDNEGLMDLISLGCHLTYLVTGRGTVVGSAVAPVIKITGNTNTFRKMEDDMDFDAGKVLDGRCSPDELVEELIDLTCAVASGVKSKSEDLGHKEYYIPYKYQDGSVISHCKEKEENYV